MNELIYLSISKTNPDFIEYLHDMPNLKSINNYSKNIWVIQINDMDLDDTLETIKNLSDDFYVDVSIFPDSLFLTGNLLNDLIYLLKDKKTGVFSLSNLLVDAVLLNDIKIENDFRIFLENKLSKDLIETGLVFIEQGNTIKAANSLYLHRNTLNYRLSVIKKSTSLDLKRFVDAFVFYGIMSSKFVQDEHR